MTNFAPEMTLRDWFAGQALAGLAAIDANCTAENLAKDAYLYADEMLKLRNKEIANVVAKAKGANFND